MKILLFGKTGQVGRALMQRLPALGDVIALSRGDPEAGDLLYPDSLYNTIRRIRPDVIINAAAFTNVDAAESEDIAANTINSLSPASIAKAARSVDALFVHYSTDYVFDGSGSAPWVEKDTPNPINVYGITKLAGEMAIQSSGCNHLIFRISWVFAPEGKNFITTMIRLAKEKTSLSVISDQWGAPTSADFVAEMTKLAILRVADNQKLCGLYHVVPAGFTNWFEYARYALKFAMELRPELKWKLKSLNEVKTVDYPTVASRPLNSCLSTQLFSDTFGFAIPEWDIGVTATIREILKYEEKDKFS